MTPIEEVSKRINESAEQEGKERRYRAIEECKSKAQKALQLVKENCLELFVDQYGTPFAAVKVKDHVEVLSLNTSRFRNWLCKLYYVENEALLNGEEVASILNVLRAEAEFGENRKQMVLRVADNDTSLIYDLTNSKWQAVTIGAEGWKVGPAPTIFLRYNNHQEQVYPTGEYPADIFDRFLHLFNIADLEQKVLLKCYIISLFFPKIPRPALMLHGEQGSAKSTSQELIKMLVDPSTVKTLSFPRDSVELIQKLSHNYIAYFDNISHIPDWVSDELCRAVTGSGFSKRQLYTDNDDVIYNFMRCIGFNGINLGATKADLLDRGLIIQLERIPDERRRKACEIWQEFESLKPGLLGYIMDILVKVLSKRSVFSLKVHPRMADFAELAEVISRSMGYPDGEFLKAYYRNIGLQTEEAIDANPVASTITKYMEDKSKWIGSATQLLQELEAFLVSTNVSPAKIDGWPKGPQILSRRLNEVRTNLRQIGISIERPKDSATNTRLVLICKIPPVALEAPTQRDPAQKELQISRDVLSDSKVSPEIPPVILRDDATGDAGDTLHADTNSKEGKQ
jgi:hypothetical protein